MLPGITWQAVEEPQRGVTPLLLKYVHCSETDRKYFKMLVSGDLQKVPLQKVIKWGGSCSIL
jgi:hypothetical protein